MTVARGRWLPASFGRACAFLRKKLSTRLHADLQVRNLAALPPGGGACRCLGQIARCRSLLLNYRQRLSCRATGLGATHHRVLIAVEPSGPPLARQPAESG